VIKVVHITPHLGGGIGKALFALIVGATDTQYEHQILLIDKPKKRYFIRKLSTLGIPIVSHTDTSELAKAIIEADIVQLEWWCHPKTFEFLCHHVTSPIRLLVWSHNSGVYTPTIPVDLIKSADRFVFTSRCSFSLPYVRRLEDCYLDRLRFVSSGTGLIKPLKLRPNAYDHPSFGYVGYLGFSKLHPEYLTILNSVSRHEFRVHLWGDGPNIMTLKKECLRLRRPNLIMYHGYAREPAFAFSTFNTLLYLLNPLHYGTAENSLLEAMSAGIVPVVLNNRAESELIINGKTGIIVSDKNDFRTALKELYSNPRFMEYLGLNARDHVTKKYNPHNMAEGMIKVYEEVLDFSKTSRNFSQIFGNEPADWFSSCQAETAEHEENKRYSQYIMMEKTKGSIWHFLHYFPKDGKLIDLAYSIARRYQHG